MPVIVVTIRSIKIELLLICEDHIFPCAIPKGRCGKEKAFSLVFIIQGGSFSHFQSNKSFSAYGSVNRSQRYAQIELIFQSAGRYEAIFRQAAVYSTQTSSTWLFWSSQYLYDHSLRSWPRFSSECCGSSSMAAPISLQFEFGSFPLKTIDESSFGLHRESSFLSASCPNCWMVGIHCNNSSFQHFGRKFLNLSTGR